MTASKVLTGARTVVYMQGRKMRCVKDLKVNFAAREIVTAAVTFYEPMEQQGSTTKMRMVDLPNGEKQLFTHTMKAYVTGFETQPDGRLGIHLVAAALKGYTKQDEKILLELINRCSEPIAEVS